MKRFLIALAMLMATSFSFALDSRDVNSAGFDKLTQTQKAEILKQVAEQADKAQATADVIPAPPPVSTAKAVSEWVEVGSKIGQGLAGAAKEVGVAVNDFVKTPVGKLTMAIIVWKFMGGVLVHFMGAMLILLLGTVFTFMMYRRMTAITIAYDPERKDMFGRSVKLKVQRPALSGDDMWGLAAMMFVTVIASMIAMFTF